MTRRSTGLDYSSLGLAVYHRIERLVQASGGAELRVARTQLGWARRRGFVYMWRPGDWLGPRGAPLAVSIALPDRDDSVRWKQVVQPRPGLWLHHLEVAAAADIDHEVERWLGLAYEAAG